MQAHNETTGERIASHIEVASTPLDRLKGLLGRNSLPRDEGLLIQSCNAVHTFGMKFPIDVVFLDRENRVVAIRENMPPSRLSPLYFSAKSVLELPAGTVEGLRMAKGDRLIFS